MSSFLQRLPPLASTGVGSLPFPDARIGAAHAAEAYELPFCPQLPRLDGDMIQEWLGFGPSGCEWSPERDRERPAAWPALIAELKRRPPAHGVVKLQVTGPVTLASALARVGARDGWGREVAKLAEEIALWLAASATGQVHALAELGLDALLVIDEPGLANAGLGLDRVSLWDPLRAAAGAWGLHICGPVPWELVEAASPDVLSFDVARYGLPEPARRTLVALLARGGRVMWGSVDPLAPGSPATAAGIVAAACGALGGSRPLCETLSGSLISASCGTGTTSVEHELMVSSVLAEAADTIRATSVSPRAPRTLDGRRPSTSRTRVRA